MTPLETFSLLVYVQPFFFLMLYRVNFPRLEPSLNWVLCTSGIFASGLVLYLDLGLGNYTTVILSQYCLMVSVVWWLLRDLPPLKAASLAFLVVFINSYAWEFPIHVLDFIENRNLGLQIIQGLHLAPLFLYTYVTGLEWWPKVKTYLNPLMICWIFTLAATLGRNLYAGPLDAYFMQINRYSTLLVTVSILTPYHLPIFENNLKFAKKAA